MPQRSPRCSNLAAAIAAIALSLTASASHGQASLPVPRPTPPYVLDPPADAGAKAAAPRVTATISMEEDPAAVAAQWKTGKALRVWSAEPDNAAVRDWVARLWAAMPAASRPAAPYAVQRDDALARGMLRIEREE